MRLTLDENGNGVIRFGEEELFPAAVDPNGFYPPTFAAVDPLGNIGGSLSGLRSGFNYAVIATQAGDKRLQLQAKRGQIMESWCALQTPEPVPGFFCGDRTLAYANEGLTCVTSDGSGTVIDCDVAQQCGACVCDDSSCEARKDDEHNEFILDAALTRGGNTLEGTFESFDGSFTLRMTR